MTTSRQLVVATLATISAEEDDDDDDYYYYYLCDRPAGNRGRRTLISATAN